MLVDMDVLVVLGAGSDDGRTSAAAVLEEAHGRVGRRCVVLQRL